MGENVTEGWRIWIPACAGITGECQQNLAGEHLQNEDQTAIGMVARQYLASGVQA